MAGFVLFPLAVWLMWALSPIAILYNIIRSLFHAGDRIQEVGWLVDEAINIIENSSLTIEQRLKELAILIDRMGNVIFGPLFSDIFITKAGYKFGNRHETISKVLGLNLQSGTLRKAGKVIVFILNLIETNHVQKATAKHEN